MTISASLVKELRERTGAGMMECKKALVETGGDIEAAVEHMRKQGLAKADKKAGRIAAEGLVVITATPDHKAAAVLEVNCETDFVAGGDDFRNFSQRVGELVLAQRPADLEALLAADMDGATVEETRRGLVAKIGENIGVRRFALMESTGLIGSYLHGTRIGVLVALEGGDDGLARDIAMHIAASRPQYVDETQVPADYLDKEREILVEQAKGEGKPAEIVAKMVEGRLRKQLAEITLVGQPFVKDPDTTVGKLLKEHGATVQSFVRFEVGEGIEKKADNFVEEVMAQVRGG
ncbi:translation elongation factor Ts [Thioalkalivibrio sp. XN279]|uniref:translation elongation factor Ts n=1 Tax=Thioalkalivibrio sp. XN279 TaxID=2714953 RepID=UPI0014097045|nr:translation elongation factor Ts [Thioalkalivibrio sp. XN279]NHA15302.1 elongation factor Ts [Thioalkalivibrio sp. XN279]